MTIDDISGDDEPLNHFRPINQSSYHFDGSIQAYQVILIPAASWGFDAVPRTGEFRKGTLLVPQLEPRRDSGHE
jgi:hypothetical protein